MDGFKLLRDFWDFAFENPHKISTNHCALYCYIINHSNRLGWKDIMGLPTDITKEAVGIKSYKTYIKTLNDLIDLGFVILIEKSRNQYSSNIIALVNFTEATTKALDKAMLTQVVKQLPEQVKSTTQSKLSIDNLIPNTEKLITNREERNEIFISELMESQQWIEVVCSQNKITVPQLKNWLYVFDAKLKSELDVKNSKKDFTSHFSRWLPGEMIKQKNHKVVESVEQKPQYMQKPLS